MSYSTGLALQAALYDALAGDADLEGLVAGAIHDGVPRPAPDLFVTLGAEDVRARGDATGWITTHETQVSVLTTRPGYADAKTVAARICAVLETAAPGLSDGRVLRVRMLRARARFDKEETARRIDLTIRVDVDMVNEGN